jgi:uncharacterized membrane protein
MARAARVREIIKNLGWSNGRAGQYLVLEDIAVAVRNWDGSFILDRELFSDVANVSGVTTVGFLAGLALSAPLLTSAAVGAMFGGAATAAAAAEAGIGDEFVSEVEKLMRPGTSALFVLDDAGDMEFILHAIQGLGGTVLRTNVNPERARLIQATLAEATPPSLSACLIF